VSKDPGGVRGVQGSRGVQGVQGSMGVQGARTPALLIRMSFLKVTVSINITGNA